MPLQSGTSRAIISNNLRELHSGKTFAHTAKKFGKTKANKQAIAIAMSEARQSRAWGGSSLGISHGVVRAPTLKGTGQFDMAKSPRVGMTGAAAYPARAMMRGMMRGALLTATPGRADAHKTFVPSGSYVIPADVVSGRGQGNTLAGAAVLHNMFGMKPYGGSSGPYQSAMSHLKIGRGPKLPKPPKAPSLSNGVASGGGKEGNDESLGAPVPVNLSGGEIVVPPENLIMTFRRIFPGKNYPLKQIHAMMDRWILREREQHRKTLAKLPGPARD